MLDSIIGNDDIKSQIKVSVKAAVERNMSIPHMLFSGAAGCGKTSTASAVASLAGVPFISVVPNDIKDYDSVTRVLDLLNHDSYDRKGNRTGTINPTILFLDEVHNLPIKGQELMGLVMERFMIESGKPNGYFWVPFFTLIGATTVAGSLSKPFRDRFKMTFNFQPYGTADMIDIVKHHVKRIGVPATQSAIAEIAVRGRGTPRTVVGYIERIRDAAISSGSKIVTDMFVKEVFSNMGIDDEGLNKIENRILIELSKARTPIGLDNLSMLLQEDSKSIRDYAEPFLLRKGFMTVSGRGRLITDKGFQHVNKTTNSKCIKEEIGYDYVRM